MNESKKSISGGLLSEFKRFDAAADAGNMEFIFNTDDLSADEAEAITLMKKAVGKYRESFEYDVMKYKLSNDALNIALWDMDVISADPVNPKNKITFSKEFRHMLGFSNESDFPNELHSWSSRLHAEDKDGTLTAFAEHMLDRTGKTPFDIEYRLFMKNGECRHFHALGTSLRDSEGAPVRVAGALMDITEKKQMEEKINYRNNLLQSTTSAAALLLNSDIDSFEGALKQSMKVVAEAVSVDRVCVWKNFTQDGKLYCTQIFEWSENVPPLIGGNITMDISYSEKLPGWEETLSSGKCVNNLIHNLSPEEQAQLTIQNVVSLLVVPIFVKDQFWGFVGFDDCYSERVFTEEEESILRSGGILFADALLRNEMVVNLRENAARLKAAAEKAIEDEERMQLMLDAMPLTCHLINRNYEIIDCNKEALNLFGAAGKEEYSKRYDDFLPELQPCGNRSQDLNDKYIDEAFEKGHMRFEWVYQNLSGELMPCEITLIRVRYKGEDIIAEYARDLREQKAVIEEMRRAEVAEESNKAKSQFLATMSHEIRTPMNSIMGFAELAQDNDVAPQVKDYLGKITDSTRWLLRIINDILDISKIESGKMELENVPFDLHEVFARCQSVILPSIKEKGLDMRVYVEPLAGKRLLGDSVRLYQVIMNLLSNAVKFTDSGTIKLSSTVKHSPNVTDPGAALLKEEDRVTVYFEVKDSGIGMNSEQIDKVFAPFIQADSSTTRNYGGTGLGLAITKNIVELMGGKLKVESSPGAGSTFSFEIRFDAIDAPDNIAADTKINMLEKPSFEGLVLICDDNTMNQEVICKHLARVGLRTQVAENGKIGVEMVRERIETGKPPFDLIFMDMFMPVMDGMEAASKIIALDTKTPIVAMTANIMASEVENYKKNGMPDCLGKPFMSQDLWRVLLKHLTPVSLDSMLDDDSDAELQKKLRIDFVKKYQTIHIEIADAVAVGDTRLAHRLAHTLKGNAGLIGKNSLKKAAEEVESLLKDGIASIWESKMNSLETELMQVIDELKPLLNEPDNSEEKEKAAPPDAAQVRALFEKLGPLLENLNPECFEMLDGIRAVPGAEELARQVEEFDFESAAKTLAELKEAGVGS